MTTLFAFFDLARAAADHALAQGQASFGMELGFKSDDDMRGVTMYLKIADVPDAQPFAMRAFTPAEFESFLASLQNIRNELSAG